jgi:hypothetical protein
VRVVTPEGTRKSPDAENPAVSGVRDTTPLFEDTRRVISALDEAAPPPPSPTEICEPVRHELPNRRKPVSQVLQVAPV